MERMTSFFHYQLFLFLQTIFILLLLFVCLADVNSLILTSLNPFLHNIE